MKKILRNSSFELIKVIAIICIVFCHCIPAERIEYHYATNDPWLFGVMMFRQLGSVGNAIFMVASTWFLVESDNTNLRKMKNMIADNQFISIIFLIIMWEYYTIDLKLVIKQIFPFMFSTLWYITCYVMYYCLHGFINKALRCSDLNDKVTLAVLFVLNWFYFVAGGGYFSDLVGFVLVHVFTWHLKRLLRNTRDDKILKCGKIILVIGLFGWLVGAVVLNYIGIHIDILGHKFHQWNRYFNPFILSLAYGSLLIASTKMFYSRVINKLSSVSLYVYIITGNQLLRIYTDNYLYDMICDKFGNYMNICFLFCVVYSVVKFCAGTLLAITYHHTLGVFVKYVSVKECVLASKIISKYN